MAAVAAVAAVAYVYINIHKNIMPRFCCTVVVLKTKNYVRHLPPKTCCAQVNWERRAHEPLDTYSALRMRVRRVRYGKIPANGGFCQRPSFINGFFLPRRRHSASLRPLDDQPHHIFYRPRLVHSRFRWVSFCFTRFAHLTDARLLSQKIRIPPTPTIVYR